MSNQLKNAEAESEARGRLLERLRRALGGDTWDEAVKRAEAMVEQRDALQEALAAVVEHGEYDSSTQELHVDMERVAAALDVESEDAIGELQTRAWDGTV